MFDLQGSRVNEKKETHLEQVLPVRVQHRYESPDIVGRVPERKLSCLEVGQLQRRPDGGRGSTERLEDAELLINLRIAWQKWTPVRLDDSGSHREEDMKKKEEKKRKAITNTFSSTNFVGIEGGTDATHHLREYATSGPDVQGYGVVLYVQQDFRRPVPERDNLVCVRTIRDAHLSIVKRREEKISSLLLPSFIIDYGHKDAITFELVMVSYQ
jgi:hypothetical protein